MPEMKRAEPRRESSRRRSEVPAELEGSAAELFGRLRALRAKLARLQGVPAYVVFSDKTLRELAVTRPQTMAEFRAVGGVGDVKAKKYGKSFLAEITGFQD